MQAVRFKARFLAAAFALAMLSTAFGQGTFQNLNFESATVPVSQPASPPGVPTVDISVALPGWTAFIGTNQASMVMYNSRTLDTSAVSLIRDNSQVLPVIEGSFSVFLLGGYAGAIPTDTSLSQTGLIPSFAQSVQFRAAFGRVEVSLDGEVLSRVPLQVTSEYTLFGADVTQSAGQVRELRFTVFAPSDGGGGLPELLDSISFSSQPIPEPRLFCLFALGALLLGWQVGRKRR